MAKMLRLKWTSMSLGAVLAALTGIASTEAAECPRKDALGTSRVLSVDAKTTPRVGLKSFPQTLPLADHEVVLTFDDGPNPPTTSKVLAALAQECVRATFFLIGLHASEHPDMVKRIAREGHTIGHHTWSHPFMARIPFDKSKSEIDRGIAADEMALHGRLDHDALDAVLPLPLFRVRRKASSTCFSRAASSCSGPTCGPATGTR